MSKKYFLGKIKNSDDRDCVKYIEFGNFECGHYFSAFHIEGACFSGFEKELQDVILNDFDNFDTILTKQDFERLFEIKKKINDLGYGIKKDSDKYNLGIKYLKELDFFKEKLDSKENEILFNKIIEEEKQFCMEQYYLSREDIDFIFENYGLDYQDRAIIGVVFENFDEMVYEEKFSYGYENVPYFDDEAFGKDLLETENYLELENGKIVTYCY